MITLPFVIVDIGVIDHKMYSAQDQPAFSGNCLRNVNYCYNPLCCLPGIVVSISR